MTRRYPAYRYSGVDWLGPLPSGWEVMNPRRIFSQAREPAQATDEQLSATQKSGVIPQRLYMEQEDQKVVLALAGLDSFKRVRAGDFVISLRSFQGGIERSLYDGCVSPAYTVLRPRREIDGGYFRYLLKADEFILKLQSVTSGIRDGRNVSYEQFALVPLCFPPLPEQTGIATFLDRETSKIDALVEEQRRLIDLLREKRQALISHAVTRGLNLDAKLKPSGVDWLGDVPEEWRVVPLKYLVSHVVDCLHTTPTYDGELLYPAIRTADVDRGVLLLEQARLVSQEVYDERIQRLKPIADDVLYSREGERLGMAALVPEGVDLCLGQRMMMFRAKNNTCPGYLMWALNSEPVYQQVMEKNIGSTSPHVNIGDVINFRFPCPTFEEQVRIADYLSVSASRLTNAVQTAEEGIALLQERRAALISAAVTGKIDVRENMTDEVAA